MSEWRRAATFVWWFSIASLLVALGMMALQVSDDVPLWRSLLGCVLIVNAGQSLAKATAWKL